MINATYSPGSQETHVLFLALLWLSYKTGSSLRLILNFCGGTEPRSSFAPRSH